MRSPFFFRVPALVASALFLSALSASAQVKWHPGNYVRLNAEKKDEESWNDNVTVANGEATLKGILVTFYWAALEGATPGSYDFSRIDEILGDLDDDKRLIIEIWDHKFSGSTFDDTVLPAYLNSTAYWADISPGICAKQWDHEVMGHFIALFQALGARYDHNPKVEMIRAGETARGLTTALNTTEAAAWLTEWMDWITFTRAAWPNTNVQIGTNYRPNGVSETQMKSLIGHCLAENVMCGGPDIRLPQTDPNLPPENPTLGTNIINNVVSTPWNRDLRGAVGERPEIGLSYDQQYPHSHYTPSGIYSKATSSQTDPEAQRPSHIAWKQHFTINDHTPEVMLWIPESGGGVLSFLQDTAHQNTIMAVPTTYEMRGWWRFEEGTGTTASDTSGISGNASLNGATWTGGKAGRGVNFSGTAQYVDLPDSTLGFETGMTIALWAKPDGTTPNNARFVELGNGAPSNNIIFSRKGTTSEMRLKIYDASGSTEAVSGTGVITGNVWQHLAVTVTASGVVQFYKDGSAVGSPGSVAVPTAQTRNNNYIGKSDWAADPLYAGRIDDVHVYARALEPAEISALKASGTGVNLMTNPGFETDQDWTNYPGASALQDMGTTQAGTYRLKITSPGFTEVYQEIPVVVDATYVATAWSRTWSSNGLSRGQMRLQFFNSGGSQVGSTVDVTATNGDSWAQLPPTSVTAPANATHLRMTLRRSAALAGNYYFDSAEIKQ